MSINETIKSIHTLAVLRDDIAGKTVTSIVISPEVLESPQPGETADVAREWFAQTYRGKGQWGGVAGSGKTPEEALEALHRGLVNSHLALDSRRCDALMVASGLGLSEHIASTKAGFDSLSAEIQARRAARDSEAAGEALDSETAPIK